MEASEIISEAIERYNPSHVFGLFSGGHDSLCACHVASQHPRFDGCIHIKTGIGIKETREFVQDTCKRFGWPLHVYHPMDSYEDLVIDQGFPGPGMHWKMYDRLKERCLRHVLRECRDPTDRRRKIAFVSGVRRKESVRRMINIGINPITTGLKNPSPRIVWANPLIDWDGDDKRRYMDANDLPHNRVVELLCMSGECLCGAFAQPGELEMIRSFYPAAAEEIDRIAVNVKAAGKHCVWGTRPPGTRNKPDPRQMELPLCWSCEAKGN
jgi:3'-phosphoadenosine 5'-phosphosulfate sulfotransferase (PAPS reductase)/FAD synthetase